MAKNVVYYNLGNRIWPSLAQHFITQEFLRQDKNWFAIHHF